jgi:hypothetical protein
MGCYKFVILNVEAVQGVQSKQAIAELMQSPQFHQQLDSFTQVLLQSSFCDILSLAVTTFSVFWGACNSIFSYLLKMSCC